MGSLFSTPKPILASNPGAQPATASTVDEDAEVSAAAAASDARAEALERRRYGRASLIATSYRGLLNDRISGLGGGKNLLGE
ncbi:hypothetical protein [Thalassospira sp.]|uniref:hypothetical protein n=1 Tax=Thalassospira sp. TaxID=1912094 RepID=UPI00311DE525